MKRKFGVPFRIFQIRETKMLQIGNFRFNREIGKIKKMI